MEMKWLSIVLAAFAAVVLGYVWHNLIFENVAQNKSEHRLPQVMYIVLAYAFSFVIALGLWKQIIGLHQYILKLKASNEAISDNMFLHGVFHGVHSSLFYGVISVLVLTALLNGKGVKWILSTVLYWVFAMGLMGGIVGALG